MSRRARLSAPGSRTPSASGRPVVPFGPPDTVRDGGPGSRRHRRASRSSVPGSSVTRRRGGAGIRRTRVRGGIRVHGQPDGWLRRSRARQLSSRLATRSAPAQGLTAHDPDRSNRAPADDLPGFAGRRPLAPSMTCSRVRSRAVRRGPHPAAVPVVGRSRVRADDLRARSTRGSGRGRTSSASPQSHDVLLDLMINHISRQIERVRGVPPARTTRRRTPTCSSRSTRSGRMATRRRATSPGSSCASPTRRSRR